MDARTDLKTLGESKKSPPLKTPLRVSFKQLSVIGLVCVAAIASCSYGYYWWTVGRYFQGTDDAYVGGNVTPVAPHISGFIAQ